MPRGVDRWVWLIHSTEGARVGEGFQGREGLWQYKVGCHSMGALSRTFCQDKYIWNQVRKIKGRA